MRSQVGVKVSRPEGERARPRERSSWGAGWRAGTSAADSPSCCSARTTALKARRDAATSSGARCWRDKARRAWGAAFMVAEVRVSAIFNDLMSKVRQ
jgi:hypothetical protein